jgi:hypothetical protein
MPTIIYQDKNIEVVDLGGAGSGNSGHAGIIGHRGGSLPKGRTSAPAATDIKASAGLLPIDYFNKRIVSQDFETAGVFKDGKLIMEKDGAKNSVQFSKDEVSKMEGAILIHNHPSGAPFSIDDYDIFFTARMKSIQAVGNEYTYVLEAPTGYDYSHGFTLRQDLDKAQMMAKLSLKDKDDWKSSNHLTSELWAEAIGLLYKRIPK